MKIRAPVRKIYKKMSANPQEGTNSCNLSNSGHKQRQG